MANLTIDSSALNNQKSLLDMQAAFEARKAAQQAADIDNVTKGNSLINQTIALGAANGADGLAAAKSKLAGMNLDASAYSDDPATAAAQALTAQKAASPYGAIFNGEQKVIGNQLAAIGTGGTEARAVAGLSTTNPNITFNPLDGSVSVNPSSPTPQTSNPSSPSPIPVSAPGQPLPNMGNTQPEPPVASTQAPLQNPNPTFSYPPNNGSMTDKQYTDARNAALETFKVNNAAAITQANAAAGVKGKDQGENSDAAISSDEITQRLLMNVGKLRDINSQIPGGFLAGPETKALIEKRLGNSDAADAIGQWKQVDQQQILSDLQQLVKGNPGLRSNKTIDQMLQRASGVPLDMSQQGRGELLDNLYSEILNKNTTTQNTNARMNGGALQPYQAIGAQPAPTTPKLVQGNIYTNSAGQKGVFDGTNIRPLN